MLRFLWVACTSVSLTAEGLAQDEDAPTSPEIRDSLIDMLGAIETNRDEIAEIWPGFMEPMGGYALIHYPDILWYVGPDPDDEAYAPLTSDTIPPSLSDIIFEADELPEDASSQASPLSITIGERDVRVMLVRRERLDRRVEFFIHENFHSFQSRVEAVFEPVDYGDLSVRFGQPMVDPELIADPEFAAMAELERRLIVDAMTSPSRDEAMEHLADYRLVRETRTTGSEMEPVLNIEARFERLEGTATFVGCAAAAASINLDDGGLQCLFEEDLMQPLDSKPAVPTPDSRLMRWRLYGTGGGLTYLIHAFGPENWRTQIEEGQAPYNLISEMVEPAPRSELDAIKACYDYENLLQLTIAAANDQDDGE